VPAGETQSTAAAGALNYSVAPADGRNQLIEVDGFGTDDWVTPAGATSGLSGSSSVGTPQESVSQLAPTASGETPGLVIITVPTSVLGTPGAGWTFTVTLTGQDGFGIDDARTFTATPGACTLGVCSSAVATGPAPPANLLVQPGRGAVGDGHTIPPTTVNVQTELDPTVNPSGVTRQGVTVP
jgi:glucoamylase